MSDKDYETAEGVGVIGGGVQSVEEARRLHHLATADPEPERDGTMTGPAHEAKYGLERAEDSAARWRAAGVHPTENRALLPGEEGAENLASTESRAADENTAAPRAKK